MTTTVTSRENNRLRWLSWLSDDDTPEWLSWLAVGFLVLNLALLVTAVFAWRSRQPQEVVVAEDEAAVVASSMESATGEGHAPAAMASAMESDTAASSGEAGLIEEKRAVKGQVSLHGRPIAGVTIMLDDTPVAETDAQGAFHIADVPAGTHTVTAQYPGYMPRQAESIEVRGEEDITLPAVSLQSGDLDADGDVDIFDIVRFAGDPQRTDVNGDGAIDVRDLIALDASYGSSGPQPW